MPHTNLNGLAEAQLLMQAGHFQWQSIAQSLGRPLSSLRTKEGHPIYATYFYVESQFPETYPINSFRLDQSLKFINRIRHFKGISIDGLTIFNQEKDLQAALASDFDLETEAESGKHPTLRMHNVFIAQESENEHLKITTPEGCSFDAIETGSGDGIYTLTRQAERSGGFDLIGSDWKKLDRQDGFSIDYSINPDRDTNGAGLVYFAQYISFLDMIERQVMGNNSTRPFTFQQINHRSLCRRKIAYYSNVNLDNVLKIQASLFQKNENELGFRYKINRKSDGKLIALSESIKKIPLP